MLLPKAETYSPAIDKKWRVAIRYIPCCVSGYAYVDGASVGVDPAHIRWRFHGMGQKSGTDRILPLAHTLHQKQHTMPEVVFWHDAWDTSAILRINAERAVSRLRQAGDPLIAMTLDDDVMGALVCLARTMFTDWMDRHGH